MITQHGATYVFVFLANIEGKSIVIHFDGWTSKYDYTTTMDDPALHPVGWFAQRGRKNPKLTQRLQPPKGTYVQ